MRLLLWVLSLPHMAASLLLEVLCQKDVFSDLDRCMEVIARHGSSVPSVFVRALVLAEDHRNDLHPGIDVIAMVRALWVAFTSGRIQGASTIEQQFVRVVSNRYHRTLRRKLREQLLALMLRRRACRHKIASAYLAVAFYGTRSVGIEALTSRFGPDLSKTAFNEALIFVAQLRHPCPLQPSDIWQKKMASRLDILFRRAGISLNAAPSVTDVGLTNRPA